MHDAIIVSDIHLGSDNCQAKSLIRLLQSIHDGELHTRRLILNGDVFDSIDFRRLRKSHWKVLSEIRKLSDRIDIIWLNGNHDGPAEIISHLLGVTVQDEDELMSGGRRILLLHGHIFDKFIDRYPIVSKIADWVYRWLQKLDRSHTFAKFAKRRSKIFLRCTQRVESESLAYAAAHGFDAVCCGHTHMPVLNEAGPIAYYNSGCWTEKPCTYLSIKDGVVALHRVGDVLDWVGEEAFMTRSSAELEPALP